MLTGIMGSLDLMKRRIASGKLEDLDRYMDAASASAQRAAGLTQRLLAFSRRQSLNSRPLDVNNLLDSLDDMLRRSIGERVDLRFSLADDLPATMLDANQLESAILNLVINARDAMPEGGRLTVETRFAEIDAAGASSIPDARPGRYVVVAVRDTGVGMGEEILEKVFDPFFTTKPLGQGTGLGLSMVYGFAKQSGGVVHIESRLGHGTTVRMYLPVADRAAEGEHHDETGVPVGAGQTVLVVEDDASVRLIVREVLGELGYGCVVAQEALGAIPILASPRRIDLLISDVGLPGMTGRELAEVARQHRPELPILLITGYAQNAAIRSDFLGTNMDMITKPFPLDVLGAKINEMLQPRH
jgi:CheY-like chemotaxis protein